MSTHHQSGNQSGWSRFTKKILGVLTAWLSAFSSAPVSAYDNSRYPPFETAKVGRGFQNISIHPNGEEWLITECSKAFTAHETCYLLIYNLKDGTYQRLGLPEEYNYLDGRFSTNGEQIVMVRQPLSKKGGHDAVMKSYAQGQIAIMNRNGSHFRVLPIPANRIVSPVMSPDETKVAYLVAGTDKPPIRSISLAYFDIWEFDLIEGEQKLFAGPLRFVHARTISYLSDHELIAGGLAPTITGSNELPDYLNRYKGSEIFRIKRGIRFAPEPSFYDLPFPRLPTVDRSGNIFYDSQPPKIGFSLTRKSPSGSITIWREPRMNLSTIKQLSVAWAGAYVGFIYTGESIKSSAGSDALGYFDIKNETWISIIPPLINDATLIPMASDD